MTDTSLVSWNASRNGGNARSRSGGVAATPAARAQRIMAGMSVAALPSDLLHLQVNRRKVFMVAVRVGGLDAQEVQPGFLDREGHPRSDPALGLEVHGDLAACRRPRGAVRRRLLPHLLLADHVPADRHVLLVAVRIGVGENEL